MNCNERTTSLQFRKEEETFKDNSFQVKMKSTFITLNHGEKKGNMTIIGIIKEHESIIHSSTSS